MNHTSVKAQKLVQCALRGKGVAQHVPITTSIMNAVRGANAKYLQELEEEKKKKRKAQEEAEDQGKDRCNVPAAGDDSQADGEKSLRKSDGVPSRRLEK